MEKRRIVLIVFIVIVIICLLKFIDFLFFPRIRLNGNGVVFLDYKKVYKDPGYQVYFRGRKTTQKVSKIGLVNSNKLGDYKIIYRLDNGLLSRKVVRTIKVRDQTPPKIKLKSYDDIYLCKKYQDNDDFTADNKKDLKYNKEDNAFDLEEYSYTAYDNYDGDITKKVIFTKTKDYYRYEVKDSSNNKTVIVRKIKYEDKEKPEIALNGSEYLDLYVGDNYDDLGVAVKDNCDSDIESKVQMENKVNMNEAGFYKVKYKVTDSSNNINEVTRYVSVSNHLQNGVIYLTFDDGPKRNTTDQILNTLKNENVKATFFVTSSGPDDLIKREYDEGHTVALHTSTHDYSYVYSSPDAYFEDLERVKKRVLDITGVESKIIRFPGGSSNTISKKYREGIMTYLTNEVLKKGYKYFDWNINSGDAGGVNTKDGVVRFVTSKLSHEKPNIVLMHDIKTHTKDALYDIISYGKANGYTFLPLTINDEIMTQGVNN